VLVRSPYIDGADAQWMPRAAAEARWIENAQREVGLDETIATLAMFDAKLAERWRSAFDRRRLPGNASPREWVEAWQAWLAAAGWPGDRTLASDEYQARAAWDELLAKVASLGVVQSRMGRDDALEALNALVAQTLFQPEVESAPVQILGLLEAAGQPFDSLWVAGLAAERWPAAPRPPPLLPPEWQRARNGPHATRAP